MPAARPRPTKPPRREVSQRALAALIFGLLALFAVLGAAANLQRGVYLAIFSVVIGPAACLLGITALRRARKDATLRPRGAIAGTILGSMAGVLGLSTLMMFLLFPAQLTQYNRCLTLAQTPAARQACITQFYRSVTGRPGGAG